MKIAKICSSGKLGTERTALEVAQKKGITVTGYRPKGSKAVFENIKETLSSKEEQSVIWNVRDSHAVLFLGFVDESKMASLAYEVAESYGRPNLFSNNSNEIIAWLDGLGEELTIHVMGPSVEEDEVASRRTSIILDKVLSHYDIVFIM